jgi:hypothetical protein
MPIDEVHSVGRFIKITQARVHSLPHIDVDQDFLKGLELISASVTT